MEEKLTLTKRDVAVLVVLIREICLMSDKSFLEALTEEPHEHLLSVFFKAEHDPIRMVAKLCTVYDMTEELGLSATQLEKFIALGGEDALKNKVH